LEKYLHNRIPNSRKKAQKAQKISRKDAKKQRKNSRDRRRQGYVGQERTQRAQKRDREWTRRKISTADGRRFTQIMEEEI
jgi:hypothetical protein